MLKRINIDIDKLNETTNIHFELVDNEVIYKSYKFIIHNYPFWYPTFMIDTIEYIDYINKKYSNTYKELFHFFVFYKAEFFDDLVYKTILEYQLTIKCSRPTLDL